MFIFGFDIPDFDRPSWDMNYAIVSKSRKKTLACVINKLMFY